jgi:hypothetical protein
MPKLSPLSGTTVTPPTPATPGSTPSATTPAAAPIDITTSDPATVLEAHRRFGGMASNQPVSTAVAGQAGTVLGLKLEVLKDPTTTASKVIEDAASRLWQRAQALESRVGMGLEQWGKGDPDVIYRRALVGQLLDAPQAVQPPALHDKAFVKKDAGLLKRVERRDQQKSFAHATTELAASMRDAGLSGPASTLEARVKKGEYTGYKQIGDYLWGVLPSSGAVRTKLEPLYWVLMLQEFAQQNADVNRAKAETASKALASGEAKFFEVDPNRFSTAVLPMIADPELRARTLVDTLLQFRDPIVVDAERAKDRAGGAGMASVLEMRTYLAGLPAQADTPEARRERALARAIVLSNPVSSGNAVLEARHTVAKLRRLSWQLVYGPESLPPGAKTTPYESIHHNFSVDTPRVIEAFVRDVCFSGGDPKTFCRLVDALGAAHKIPTQSATRAAETDELVAQALVGDAAVAQAFVDFRAASGKAGPELIEAFLVSRVKGKLDSVSPNAASGLSADEKKHLSNGNVTAEKGKYKEKLELVARLYRTLCESMPTADTLEENLFSARGATPQVAQAIIALRSKDASPVMVLQALTGARAALAGEFGKVAEGYRRVDGLKLDQQLEQLTSTYLGAVVERIGDVKTVAQQVEALASMQLALESAVTSGLEDLKDLKDPKASKGPTLAGVAAEIRAQFAQGSVDLGTYQATMARAYEAIVRATENVRAYVDARVPDVSAGKLIPSPSFLDDFIKEGPLHYARAIAQKAIRVGLEAEMSATRIVNPPGVLVLNSLGRVVFDRVIVAQSMSDLKELGAGRGDMCWVSKMDEKKMLAVGGIMSDFPGGYCHAAVYARGAGIAALSNPELSGAWKQFALNLGADKLYYDDTGGRVVMMPLAEAVKAGAVKAGEAERLKPGTNRDVRYYSWSEAEKQYQEIGQHEVVVDSERRTDLVQLYGTSTPIHGIGETATSFEDIGKVGVAARGLFGEKSLVLGLATTDPVLAERTPPGSAISTLRVQRMLKDAGVLDDWLAVFEKDPEVGKLTPSNFLESRFYTDQAYRETTRLAMGDKVRAKLSALFLDAQGQPTAAGAALLAELRANAKLAACDNWIVRSSFTAEDRPGKSGAGQYDSFPNCKTDRAILEGIVGVVASGWEQAPVENNVREEYDLSRIWPAITVMKCLDPEHSGVALSRDAGTGHRRTVSYQSVEGFGGGVEDGVTEQGKVRENGGVEHASLIAGREAPLVAGASAKELWDMVMRAERLFHDVVEPGRGLAVDMEWCVENGKLYMVQARTIRA